MDRPRIIISTLHFVTASVARLQHERRGEVTPAQQTRSSWRGRD